MSEILDIGSFIENLGSTDNERGMFYEFEPWDVLERTPEQFELMKKYDCYRDVAQFGIEAHPFQTGVLFDKVQLQMILAGNQLGKSLVAIIDDICSMTGKFPHSLRYAKGVDTGIKRTINLGNILRWGRRSKATGKILDHVCPIETDDPFEAIEVKDDSWDCGNIIGVGIYPNEKLIPSGRVAWVGTLKQARDEFWWRSFKEMIPAHLLDQKRGTGGFNNKDYEIYYANGSETHIITYEQGYDRFEAGHPSKVILDEEPLSERILTSVRQRTKRIVMVETPYRGKTFTYGLAMDALANGEDDDVKIYHATQYDCPYRTRKQIEFAKGKSPKWEIKSRIFGVHSELEDKPYFHEMYDVLQSWVRLHIPYGVKHDLTLPAGSIPSKARELTCRAVEDREGVWEVYEKPEHGKYYWFSADTAKGSVDMDDRRDANVAYVFRFPDPEKNENMEYPVEVACLRTTMPTKAFSREVFAGAVWYNCALLAPEAMGLSAGTFLNELDGYPYMYTMEIKDSVTRKMSSSVGFHTSQKRRQTLFDDMGDLIATHREDKIAPFKHKNIVVELSQLITNKVGKPDHPKNGSTDSIIAYAIGLYVFKYDKWQCTVGSSYAKTNNQEEVDSWGGRLVSPTAGKETRPILGSRRGLDERGKTNRFRR